MTQANRYKKVLVTSITLLTPNNAGQVTNLALMAPQVCMSSWELKYLDVITEVGRWNSFKKKKSPVDFYLIDLPGVLLKESSLGIMNLKDSTDSLQTSHPRLLLNQGRDLSQSLLCCNRCFVLYWNPISTSFHVYSWTIKYVGASQCNPMNPKAEILMKGRWSLVHVSKKHVITD